MDDLLGRIQILEQHVQRLQQQTTSVGEAQQSRPPGRANRGLAQRVRALEQKLQHVTSEIGPEGSPELVITGVNLRIVNGLERTDLPNGTGNLIVGYNEPRRAQSVELVGPDNRSGSHNVVVGTGLNFESVGGLVVGRDNTISFFSVSLGNANRADGSFTVVTGGQFNRASQNFSAVNGGESNTASGFGASISGGNSNTADGSNSVVSGGLNNTASGTVAVVSGGRENSAQAVASSISGGFRRTTSGEFDWRAGGLFQGQ